MKPIGVFMLHLAMANQSTLPAKSKERPVKNICQNCSVPCESIDASPEGHLASSSPLSGSSKERPVQGVSTGDRESLPSASNETQTSPTREGADDEIHSLAQYIHGKIFNSSLSLRKRLFQQITMYFGFAIYATMTVTVHLLKVDRRYPPLSAIHFSAHLAWLITTSSFCYLLWLAILLDHTKTVPELRADVASALAKTKSRCNIIGRIGAIALHIHIADSILTIHWFIKCLRELMPVYETWNMASILVWVSCWITCIVAVILGVVINYGLKIPLDAFGESIGKCQLKTAEDACSKASLIEPKTEKPRSASIVNTHADPQSKNAPATKSSISSFPLAGPTTEDCKNSVSLGYSVQLGLSFWLFILHYTWLEVELAPDTYIFLGWLCMAPRWWATGFSVFILSSTASLKADLCTKVPKTEELLSRASMERTQLLTQARSFISAIILSVDLVCLVDVFFKKIHSIDPSYQAEKQDLEIAHYFLFICVCMAFASIPWMCLEDYTLTVSEYNRQLDELDEELKETATKNDHADPIVPDSCFSPSQMGEMRKQARDTVLLEKRDGSPALMGTEEPAEDDWQIVEQESNDEDASDISNAFAQGVATETLFSDTNEAELECDGSTCKWKLLHDELHTIAWTRLADQQAAVGDLKDILEAMEVKANESEEALNRLDKEACALERASYKRSR